MAARRIRAACGHVYDPEAHAACPVCGHATAPAPAPPEAAPPSPGPAPVAPPTARAPAAPARRWVWVLGAVVVAAAAAVAVWLLGKPLLSGRAHEAVVGTWKLDQPRKQLILTRDNQATFRN